MQQRWRGERRGPTQRAGLLAEHWALLLWPHSSICWPSACPFRTAPGIGGPACVLRSCNCRPSPTLRVVADPPGEKQPLSFRETLARRATFRDEADAARGRLIAATIVLEEMIGETISVHFQPVGLNRGDGKAIARLDFNARLQHLKSLVETCGLWDVYGDLWTRLDHLRLERNIAAHAMIDLSESGVPEADSVLLNRRSRKGEDVTDLEGFAAMPPQRDGSCRNTSLWTTSSTRYAGGSSPPRASGLTRLSEP